MIKCETLGMQDNAVSNPTLTSASEVKNNQFITYDGDLYLIDNTVSGDDAYIDDVTFSAGKYLNGYLVKAWETQNLIVDEKHIKYADSKSYTDLSVGDVLTANSDGTLSVVSDVPDAGVYFKIVKKCRLTERAVKVKICVVTAAGTTE